MLLRVDMYRQKAAEAKQSAARAQSPFIKRAFEEVASGWLILADQMEWMDRQKASTPEPPTPDLAPNASCPASKKRNPRRLPRGSH
jgi:hypothetical protein